MKLDVLSVIIGAVLICALRMKDQEQIQELGKELEKYVSACVYKNDQRHSSAKTPFADSITSYSNALMWPCTFTFHSPVHQ